MAREWGWLKGGIALGLLSAFAFITYSPLGVSTSYPRAVALALDTVVPGFVAENAYFQRVPPIVDWQLMLVLGIIAGGFIASRVVRRGQTASCSVPVDTSHRREITDPDETSGADETVSTRIKASDSLKTMPSRRKWTAFFGGFLILFGARMAGGCTSGHVITGMTQLATASFLFAAAVFAVGIPVAKMTKRKGWI